MIIQDKTFERWLKANFTRSELKQIAYSYYGANAGWRGLIDYTDTTKLYEKFKDEIWGYIIEESQEMEYSNPFAYLAEFKSAKSIDDNATMKHWLVCHTAQIIADRLTERK